MCPADTSRSTRDGALIIIAVVILAADGNTCKLVEWSCEGEVPECSQLMLGAERSLQKGGAKRVAESILGIGVQLQLLDAMPNILGLGLPENNFGILHGPNITG